MKQSYKKVLLIDDDAIMKYISEKLIKLSNLAQEVVSVVNGLEAKEYLEKTFSTNHNELPDLIFLDLYMGAMTGFEFLDWYKTWTPQLEDFPRVYILSSTVNEEDSNKVDTYKEVAGFIRKPITMENLKQMIEERSAS